MANLRDFKKEVDYRLEEFVFDCDMAIYFQPTKEEAIVALMQKGVELRNELYVKANNPAEPHNKKRKHSQSRLRGHYRVGGAVVGLCGISASSPLRVGARHQGGSSQRDHPLRSVLP